MSYSVFNRPATRVLALNVSRVDEVADLLGVAHCDAAQPSATRDYLRPAPSRNSATAVLPVMRAILAAVSP